jgi:hypothetical protein
VIGDDEVSTIMIGAATNMGQKDLLYRDCHCGTRITRLLDTADKVCAEYF